MSTRSLINYLYFILFIIIGKKKKNDIGKVAKECGIAKSALRAKLTGKTGEKRIEKNSNERRERWSIFEGTSRNNKKGNVEMIWSISH